MSRLSKTIDFLRLRAENIIAVLLFSMFVTFLLQILFRRVLGWSVGWTVEWVTIAWLWGILFGYAFVVKESEVIRLDIVYSAVPRPMRRGFDIFAGLVGAAIFIWTMPAAVDYIAFMAREKTAYLRWPFHLVFAIYVPFSLSVIARCLFTAWQGVSGTGPHAAPVAESHDYD